MSNNVNVKLTVVWEHELRAAAKMLAVVRDSLAAVEAIVDTKSPEASEARRAFSDNTLAAVDACQAALLGCEDETVAITICSRPEPVRQRMGKLNR